MEKGEIGILTAQFGALIVFLLLLSNFFATGYTATSTPAISTVYWGVPSGNVQLAKGVTNTEAANASTISAFFTLAYSTTPASVTAGRLCLNADQHNIGGFLTYGNVTILYDASQHLNYISFGPTDQIPGQTCTYTIQLTDSLQQSFTWVAIVQLKS